MTSSSLVASGLRAATRSYFGPVVDRRAVPASGRAAIVNARVGLASGCGPVGAIRPIARHVRLDASLRTAKLVGARLPSGSRSAAVLPVRILDLVRAAAQRSDVHDATDVSVAVRFHLANALHAPLRELSRTSRALRSGAHVQVVCSCIAIPAAVGEAVELVGDAAEYARLLRTESAEALAGVGRSDDCPARC